MKPELAVDLSGLETDRLTVHLVEHPAGGKALVMVGRLPADLNLPVNVISVLERTLARVMTETLEAEWPS